MKLRMNQSGSLQNDNDVFFFDPADRIYADHFPGNPVVPGSLIVQAFMTAGRGMGFTTCAVENFRFKKFISPGEYDFSIQVLSDRLRCELYDENKTVATGILKV